MERNVEQHAAFLPSLTTFKQYAEDCLEGKKEFDSKFFTGLIDAFATILATHLKEEIDTLLDLGKYKEKYDAEELKKAYLALAADAKNADKVR